ncbi:MAG TPA: hypothetical protein VEX43_11910 [Chthoniobacterales bacterium]|nr:hypothetical protein [Chthoniobacterales bacterium]
MAAAIINRIRSQIAGLAMLACLALTSCASKDPAPLIADPSAQHETALPWNQQEKWEREGQAAALTQQRR